MQRNSEKKAGFLVGKPAGRSESLEFVRGTGLFGGIYIAPRENLAWAVVVEHTHSDYLYREIGDRKFFRVVCKERGGLLIYRQRAWEGAIAPNPNERDAFGFAIPGCIEQFNALFLR